MILSLKITMEIETSTPRIVPLTNYIYYFYIIFHFLMIEFCTSSRLQ